MDFRDIDDFEANTNYGMIEDYVTETDIHEFLEVPKGKQPKVVKSFDADGKVMSEIEEEYFEEDEF